MTSNENIYLSVVIPAYNEEDRINKSLSPTINYLKSTPYKSEIIVVSDGSEDNTKETVRKYQGSDNIRLRFIEYFPNHGKGYAVKTGVLESGGQIVLFMDADYSVPIEYIENAFRLLNNGIDVVIGSRTHRESIITSRQKFFRELFGKIFGFYQMFLLNFPFSDVHCGFKIFTKEAAKILFSDCKIENNFFDPEIIYLAHRKYHYNISEMPVLWSYDKDSRITYNLPSMIKAVLQIINIRYIHNFNRKING